MSSLKIDKNPIEKDQQMYLKAIPLKDLDQISAIKDEVSRNMIVILRITPIAQKNVKELTEKYNSENSKITKLIEETFSASKIHCPY